MKNNQDRAAIVIQELAQQEGVSPAVVRASMQECLDAAWATDDPEAKAFQEQLFPDGKPTVEEFLVVLSRRAGKWQQR